jgi:hypothetical protein
MNYYHLTLTQNGYFRDKKTYWNVPARKVWAGLRYMAQNFGASYVFVYAADGQPIGSNLYIGCYSAKWDNFRPPNDKPKSTYIF